MFIPGLKNLCLSSPERGHYHMQDCDQPLFINID